MESSFVTSCSHLQQVVSPQGLERISRAAETAFTLSNRPVIGIGKEAVLKCLHPDCTFPTTPDLYVCVQCVHVACSARRAVRPLASSGSPSITKSPSPASGHVLVHHKATSHCFLLSVDHGQLYCVLCKDFVFDMRIDNVISLQRNQSRALRCRFNSALSSIDQSVTEDDLPTSSEYSLGKARYKRRRLVNLHDWVPSKKELDLISAHSLLFANTKGVMRPPVGLYNLGNSCYMNSVLQAFLNAPPLRNFFLADDHKPNCQRGSRSDCLACALETLVCESCFTSEGKYPTKEKANGSSSNGLQVPFLVPQTILDIVWRNADHLASYAQHDAHEFLICTLNLLNTHCRVEGADEKKKEKGEPVLVELKLRKEAALSSRNTSDSKRETPSSSNNALISPCDPVAEQEISEALSRSFNTSIVQRLFSGTLQSDVICRVCGNSSPTLEKFYDISLDVDKFFKPLVNRRGRTSSPSGELTPRVKHTGTSSMERGSSKGKHDTKGEHMEGHNSTDSGKQSSSKASASGNNDGEKGSESVNTLYECLARFTDPELLGSSSKMHCMTCGTRQEAMKQMSICTLPPIVCFHFKRFEQSFASVRRSEMVKINTPVEFPADGLNLTTFLTSEVLRKRTEAEMKARASNGDRRPRPTSSKRAEEKVRENEQTIYDLFAVVNHVGKIDSGHYTALVRRDGTWFRCDDEKVSRVANVDRIVRSEEAYLVFYMQRYPNFQY